MTYLLRDIDDRLWTRAKAKADADGLSLRALLLALLRGYVTGAVSIAATDRP